MIPQFRPLIDRKTLAKEVSDYILGDGFFTEFKHTEAFEQRLAELLGVKYCSVVNNGTISLSLALLAEGVRPGDTVLIPNITMIATQSAVTLIGAKPVFIDVSEENLCMDIQVARKFIENNPVKAVVYVTLNGRSHGMGELSEFYRVCADYKVGVVEDNAQSLGSCHNDRTAISCPVQGIGSFSFSMPKIITTGQGGCLVTNNDYYGTRIKKLKDFGREKGGIDQHDEFGINSKFTEIQSIMGLNQLRDISERINTRKRIYRLYRRLLAEVATDYLTLINTDLNITVPWFVDVYVERREELIAFLKENGVGTRAIYPQLTSQKINEGQFHLDVSGKYSRKGLWLPSSLDITDDEIRYVCSKIKEFYHGVSV